MKIDGLSSFHFTKEIQKAESKESNFENFLSDALAKVNNLQNDAAVKSQQLALGENVELHQVMVTTEKANLALQLTIQVRNKIVEAYQEIMRMQI